MSNSKNENSRFKSGERIRRNRITERELLEEPQETGNQKENMLEQQQETEEETR